MTRAQALHQASAILDDVADRDIEKYFEEFVYDPLIEDALRHKAARWKAEQLARIEATMTRMADDDVQSTSLH